MLCGVQTGDGTLNRINPGGTPFDNLPSTEVAKIGFQILRKTSRQQIPIAAVDSSGVRVQDAGDISSVDLILQCGVCHRSSLQAAFPAFFNSKRMSAAAFGILVPGPNIAATPASYKKS